MTTYRIVHVDRGDDPVHAPSSGLPIDGTLLRTINPAQPIEVPHALGSPQPDRRPDGSERPVPPSASEFARFQCKTTRIAGSRRSTDRRPGRFGSGTAETAHPLMIASASEMALGRASAMADPGIAGSAHSARLHSAKKRLQERRRPQATRPEAHRVPGDSDDFWCVAYPTTIERLLHPNSRGPKEKSYGTVDELISRPELREGRTKVRAAGCSPTG
jgi:hypothetical protein